VVMTPTVLSVEERGDEPLKKKCSLLSTISVHHHFILSTIMSSMIDNDDWADVEDIMDETLVVVAETLTDEEVLSDTTVLKDTMAQLTETLKSIKSSFDDNLKELQRLNKKIDEERKETTLLKELQRLNMNMEEEKNQKTLERALKLTYLDSFNYYVFKVNNCYEGGYKSECLLSSDLAEGVIGRFMLGQSAKLPISSLIDDPYKWNKMTIKEKDTMVKKFVDKFVDQIQDLIGKQPRTVKDGDMLYDIHYE
jgi:vacuolar-type H+-ATPase subunit I/STV1